MSAVVPMMREQAQPLSAGALVWAQGQGFTEEQFTALAGGLQIGEAKDIPGALVVPFLEDGKQAGVQIRRYVTGMFEPVRTVGSCDGLYNVGALWDLTLKDQPIIVTDSIPACWAFMTAGHKRTVALPFLRPIGGRRWECIDETRQFWEGSQIILAISEGPEGAEVREDLAAQFGRPRCRWLPWPKGCNGAADTFRLHGARGLQASIERAAWFSTPDIYRLSELAEPPANPAKDIGIVGLGEHYRVRLGDLAVVSGTPGTGKTSFVNEVVGRLVRRYQWRAVFASFEQRPKPDHRRALRTFHAGKLERAMSPEEKAAADAWIEEHFLFLRPADDADTDLAWLLDRLEMAVQRINAQVVVIDPWNELEHMRAP
ncbi:MAG TPA: ATPase domain-containing protein, partial [Reyranella sp.]|nr:ATPase domain-containing protein [Reyranella sp.]